MKKLILMVGNIGSGKSTYVKFLVNKGYIVVSKDDIRYSMGAGKYIFDYKLEAGVHRSTLVLLDVAMNKGYNIVIDETNMNKKTRLVYLQYASRFNYQKEAIIMPKLSMEESVKRRLQANHGDTSKEIWEEIFTRKDNRYQKPSKEEGFDIITEV